MFLSKPDNTSFYSFKGLKLMHFIHSKFVKKLDSFFLSEKSREYYEKFILQMAMLLFIVHFVVILLVDNNVIPGYSDIYAGKTFRVLSAIYTPFSFILLYEIYVLIYYLPKSITIYIGKQYEVVGLILIRDVFDDLSKMSLSLDTLQTHQIIQMLWFFGGLIVFLLLIFCFYKLADIKHAKEEENSSSPKQRKFVAIKKNLALLLILLFVALFLSSFLELRNMDSFSINGIVELIKKMSNTFFNVFFTALIIVEVFLLLYTYELSNKFSKVIRNSAFIISTILLKLSFRVAEDFSMIFVLIAIAFGVTILGVSKLFEHKLK